MILLIGDGIWGKNLKRNFASSLFRVIDKEDNLDSALNDNNIKAVVTSTPARTHFEIAQKCLNAGKDIWIEKPATETLEQAKILADQADKEKRIVFVDHTYCYDPKIIKAKQIDIGTPLYYDSIRFGGRPQPDVDVVLDLAIHDVTVLNYLYPDLELKDRTIIRNNHGYENANHALINLVFETGFTASINCNWISPIKRRDGIIVGSKSSIIYDQIEAPDIEPLQNATRHFLDCIENRIEPRTSIQKSIKPMSWLV